MDEILALLDRITELSDDELTDLREKLLAFLEKDSEAVIASAEIAQLEQLASAADAIRAEQTRRDERRTALAAQFSAMQVPADRRPVSRNTSTATAVTASGASLPDGESLGREFDEALRQGRASDKRGRIVVASLRPSGTAPVLRAGDRPQVVSATISAATTALVAAGGPGPSAITYELSGMESTARPVRDALPAFVSDRGGVRFMRSPGIAIANGATSQWTVDDDIDALTDDTIRKPSLRFASPDEVEIQLYAVTQSLTIGRFLQRSFPELIQRYVELTNANHAALGERLLIERMVAESRAVTVGATDLGGSVNLLTALERGAVVERSSRRLDPGVQFTAVLPAWIAPALRADLAAESGGTFETTDDDVNRWLALRSITPIYSLDYQQLGTQNAGAAVTYPGTVSALLFPTGDFAFFDGGTLDLGYVVDSVLLAQNDVQTFAETFENVVRFGNNPGVNLTVPFSNYGVRRAAA